MLDFPILSLLIFLPLIGALFILTVFGDEELVARNAKYAALYTSLFTFGLSLFLMSRFDPASADFQFVEKYQWLEGLNIAYHLGVDGISLFFVLLSAFLTPVCILASWDSIKTRVKEYMIAFLLLETFMIGTFLALDIFLFYVFFEAVLIPMFLIIGIWGGENRVYSAFKFFLYTFLGSVLMLIGFITIYITTGTSDISLLIENPVARHLQIWLWLAFFASFAVKMPMWPVHTWLPDAHVQAPTAGSIILAGVLLKMGGYGFLRFSLPMLPEASEYFAPLVYWLSVIAIIYTSLVALAQDDMKKMIAYSSVAHMGFVTLGIFTATTQGIEGGIFQMLSHGLISGALFLAVGVVYDRLHTRDISRYGGVVRNMPKYATVFMVLVLGSVGLPGTSGFVGEFLSLMGAFRVDPVIATFATLGMVLGATYMLWLYRKVVFGPQSHADSAAMPDLNKRELSMFVPIVILIIWMGVSPSIVMDKISPSVDKLITNYEAAIEKADARMIRLQADQIQPAAGQSAEAPFSYLRAIDFPPQPKEIRNEH